jgi:transposase
MICLRSACFLLVFLSILGMVFEGFVRVIAQVPFFGFLFLGTRLRGCLKSRLRVTDHRGVMPITINTDKLYDNLTDAAWALIGPMLPAARRGGRPRTTNIRAVLNAIFYLLRTGCQWRLLPREFPVWSTVYHYFRAWKNGGVWTCVQRSMYQQARRQAGRTA